MNELSKADIAIGELRRIADTCHRVANGALNTAGSKATVRDYKITLREIRDSALRAIERTKEQA